MTSTSHTSQRNGALRRLQEPVMELLTEPLLAPRGEHPFACDFLFGNPHDMPLPGFARALQAQIELQDKDWSAYRTGEPAARRLRAALMDRSLPVFESAIRLAQARRPVAVATP